MIISWLFEIDTYRWSTQATTFGPVDYTAKIYPESFGGISMGWDISGGGLIYPSDLEFEIDNSDGGLARADIEGEYCTIKLITNDTLTRTWKFYVTAAVLSYGKIHVYCSGILQKYLTGDYPNTPHPRETWVSANHEPEDGEYDDYRIPVIFGTAYIPLMYVYHALDDTGYYVLGEDAAYTIDEVKSPPESGVLVWGSGDYTFNQSTDSGYKLAEFVIAFTESGYVEGTWPSNQKPLVKYSKTTGSTVLPGTILYDVLRDFGVPAGDIDSWTTAAAKYATQGIEWNGGFYTVQDREFILSDLLIQCDSILYVSDKIELHPFSKTSKETFTTAKTKSLSYRPSKITKAVSDSGHVAWAEDGYPQTKLEGKALVPVNTTAINPDKSTFKCRFINDSTTAQKLGILHFQRKLAVKDSISFSTVGSVMSTLGTLKPGDVVTVDDVMLGGEQDIIISELEILPDLTVNISGRSFSILQEFDDISVSAITVTEDTTEYNLGGTDIDHVVISGASVFKFVAGSSVPVSSPIVLTAHLFGSLTEYDWEYWTGSVWTNLSGTQDESTYSLAYNNAAWGSAETLLVRCLSGTEYDVITITKLYDGIPGIDASNWSSDIEFSATDYRTVAWASGSLYSNSVTYTISAGNTGSMSPATAYYIYLKPSSSITTLLVTTDPEVSVGPAQVLVAVAFPNADTSVKARFQVFGGQGGVFINADNIAASCITGDKIVGNTITSSHIQVGTITIGSLSGASTFTAHDTTYVNGTAASTVKTNAAAGATFTSGDAGSLAYADSVNFSTLTDDGGTLTISSSKLIINTALGVELTGSGSLKITDSNSTYSTVKAVWAYKAYESGYVHDANISSNTSTSQLSFSNYKYIGALGGRFSIGGTITTNARLTLAASTVYDTWPLAASITGKVYSTGEIETTSSVTAASFVGAKINFGDSDLDYYEEGTYTAALTCTGTITLNSAMRTLAYTKIGNKVTVTGELAVSSISSPSGTLKVSLPFAIDTGSSYNSEYFTAAVIRVGINSGESAPFVMYGYSGITANIYEQTATGVNASTASLIKVSSSLLFGFSYFTA